MSTNTPHIILLDVNQNPITFGDDNIRDFVTSFTYEYKEGKEGDECEIALYIKPENFGMFNMDELQKDRGLYISWGYLGNMSPVRKIAIIDRVKKYDRSGSKLTLECTSWVYYLTKVKSDGDQGEDLYAKVLNIVKKGFDVDFSFPADWYGNKPGETLHMTLNEEGTPSTYYFTSGEKKEKVERKPVVGDNISGYIGGLGYSRPMEWPTNKVEADDILSRLNHVVLEELEDIIKQYDDSMILDARDNTLIIKNRELNAPARDTYTWAKDDRILAFDTETNEKTTTGDNATVITVDDNNEVKIVKAQTVQGDTIDDIEYFFRQNSSNYVDPDDLEYTVTNGKFLVRRVGESDAGTEISDPQRIEILKNVLKQNYTKTGPIQLQELTGTTPTAITKDALRNTPNTSVDNLPGRNEETPLADVPTYIPFASHQFRLAEEFKLFYGNNRFNDIVMEAMPNYNIDDIVAQMTRETVDSELKRISGTLLLEGASELTLGFGILVNGVATEDIGKYYVHGSVHKINSAGYTTELNMWKSPRLMGTVKSAYSKGITDAWDKLKKEVIIKATDFYEDMAIPFWGDDRENFIRVTKPEVDIEINKNE